MANCGAPGTWQIYYQLSPNNANPWTNYSQTVNGYQNDNPYVAVVVRSGCQRPRDVVSACDNRVMYANVACDWYIRNFAATFTIDPNYVPPAPTYDCINGQCVNSSTYKTPGNYSSLAQCQANCGSGSGCSPPNVCVPPDYCPPGMVCIPTEEWNQIEPLSSAVKGKACG